MRIPRAAAPILFALLLPAPGGAQQPLPPALSNQSPFFGGVPEGEASATPLSLTLAEAMDRGWKRNLGMMLAREDAREARGARRVVLADLLPNLSAHASESDQQINLAAFGFPPTPLFPSIVGPFRVFDARGFLTQSVLDFKALNLARSSADDVKAADLDVREAREIVALLTGDLYLEAVAGASRVEAAKAQVKAAQLAYDTAADQKKAGVAASIDVLRAQVELQAQQQRLIAAENDFQKEKLALARAIGLPVGQEFSLADSIPYRPAAPIDFDQALEQAYRTRPDYQRALALEHSAEGARRAARGEALPSVRLNADYGDIGLAPSSSHGTFSVAATLNVPIFDGGKARGHMKEADALTARRRAELEDLRARIHYEIRTSLGDVKAADDQVKVAKSALELAGQQLQLAQDRFAAGVSNTLELVQAQEADATAKENYISSLYGLNVSKAVLAKSLGVAAEMAKTLTGGTQ